MTTPTDKDLRALAEAATDGPWEWEAPMYPGQECYVRGPGRCIAEVDCGDIEQIADDNAQFIAAANPQTVIGLLDRIEAAEAKAERLEQQAAQWKGEDRGHKSSLHECYRAVTGGTGEPADWHGSRPVVECIEGLRSQLEEAKAELRTAESWDGALKREGRMLDSFEHQKRVADLRLKLTKFVNAQPEREITVWQQVLAETMLTMARWAAEPESEGTKQ